MTNQPPTITQQYFSLRTNQPPVISHQPNEQAVYLPPPRQLLTYSATNTSNLASKFTLHQLPNKSSLTSLLLLLLPPTKITKQEAHTTSAT
jgi:hypothetical protein